MLSDTKRRSNRPQAEMKLMAHISLPIGVYEVKNGSITLN